jgi:hypothetical protein
LQLLLGGEVANESAGHPYGDAGICRLAAGELHIVIPGQFLRVADCVGIAQDNLGGHVGGRPGYHVDLEGHCIARHQPRQDLGAEIAPWVLDVEVVGERTVAARARQGRMSTLSGRAKPGCDRFPFEAFGKDHG